MAEHPQRVLVMDDDANNREIFRMALEDEGYVTEGAVDGEEALAYLRASQDPVVALLDVVVPGDGGGFQVLQAAAGEASLTRHAYILLSASASADNPALGDLAIRLGAPFLHKPFSIDDLMATVAEAEKRLG